MNTAARRARAPAGSGVVLKLPKLAKVAQDPPSFRKDLFDQLRSNRPRLTKSQYKRFCDHVHLALRRYQGRCALVRADPPSNPPEPANHAKSTHRFNTLAKAARKCREAFVSLTRLDRGWLDHELVEFGHVETSDRFITHISRIEGAAARAAVAGINGQLGVDPARELAVDIAAAFDAIALPIGAGKDSPFVRLLQVATQYTDSPIADARYIAKDFKQKSRATKHSFSP